MSLIFFMNIHIAINYKYVLKLSPTQTIDNAKKFYKA